MTRLRDHEEIRSPEFEAPSSRCRQTTEGSHGYTGRTETGDGMAVLRN